MASTVPTPTPVLLVESEKGRDALLARAEAGLSQGECLVKVTDVIGVRRSVRTVPKDPRVVLVAREVPVVLRGGLTSLISYYRAPTDALDATESHYVGEALSHTYDVLLSVARVGRKPERTVVA